MYVGIPGEKTHGDKDYATVAKTNSDIEEKIGLSLATNGEVPKLAEAIKEKSLLLPASSSSYADSDDQPHNLPPKEQWKIGEFGGAQSFDKGWGTLGGSVFAVMEEIESGTNKLKYSTSSTQGHPYFPKGAKKPEFDKGLNTCSWDELPKHTQSFLRGSTPTVDYNKLTSSTKLNLLHDYRHASEAMQGTVMQLTGNSLDDGALAGVKDDLKALKDTPQDKQKREALKNKIIAIKKEKGGSDAGLDAKLGALLDIVVDEHTSGDYTNMVKRGQNAPKPGNPGNLNETPWIDDTVAAGKPIISGPSGHTLRYLNFWAEKRNMAMGESSDTTKVTGWPSLQAARLVMMADLMPPKHHSYDEIMTSSIGITDGKSKSLTYDHKSSYLDLATQEGDAEKVALKAYTDSEAYSVATDIGLDAKLSMRNADRPDAQLPEVADQAFREKQNGLVDKAITVLTLLESDPKLGREIADTIKALKVQLSPSDTSASS